MQPIQRHPSFCSTTAEGENNNTDNRAIRSMRSLGSIIRNARREAISPTRLVCCIIQLDAYRSLTLI